MDLATQKTHGDLDLLLSRAAGEILKGENTDRKGSISKAAEMVQEILHHPEALQRSISTVEANRRIKIDGPLRDLVKHGVANGWKHGALKVAKIPKGSSGKFRTILKPGIVDSVLASLQGIALTPIMEALSHQMDIGFRPRISREHGLGYIEAVIGDNPGSYWVGSVDIQDFFPSIQRWRVEQLLHGLDESLAFIQKLGTATDLANNGKNTGYPQGSPISPILSNLAMVVPMERIRARNEGLTILRYVDDILVIAQSEDQLQKAFGIIRHEIGNHGFKVNPKKTWTLGLDTNAHFDFLGYTIRTGKDSLLFSPSAKAYLKLEDKLSVAVSLKERKQIAAGWIVAYRASNDPQSWQRAQAIMAKHGIVPTSLSVPLWDARFPNLSRGPLPTA